MLVRLQTLLRSRNWQQLQTVKIVGSNQFCCLLQSPYVLT